MLELLLFLSAGNVSHCVHEYDIRKMGGLRRSRALPGTAAVAAVGAASLAGFPLITSGFYSKDAILWATLQAPFVRPGPKKPAGSRPSSCGQRPTGAMTRPS